ATIGIQDSAAAGDHDGITNANLAAVHEFGAPSVGIPSRSFMRAPFDANLDKYTRFMSERAHDLRRSFRIILGQTAQLVKSDMIRAIDDGLVPPLRPATVERKGSSKPLIDTGQLKQSITTKVEDVG
ncbi:hypothetical protein LCGC14_1463370, partial [marine sediment metagenome]